MRGQSITLKIEDPASPGSFLTIAGQRGASGSENSEIVDESSKLAARFFGSPGRIGSTIVLSGRYVPADPGQIALATHHRAQSAFDIQWIESGTVTKVVSCVCTFLDKGGANQSFAVVRATLRVVGALQEPRVDAFTVKPTDAFDFGLLADEYVIETDDTVGALLTDPNGSGFSYGVWYKGIPANIFQRMGICGSSDSWLSYSEGTALTGWITPSPASMRFFVEDADDLQPQNWSETPAGAADDNGWHFSVCVWDPGASGSRRVRHYFDGTLTGAGGNHPGNLTETWLRKWWFGKAYADSSGLIAFEGRLTHGTLWDGPLSDGEALAIWGGSGGIPGEPPDLSTRTGFITPLVLDYYPNGYVPGLGAVVADQSGNGNDAADAGVDSPVGLVADVP